MGDMWCKIIWWFIETFLMTKQDKKDNEKYEIEQEKKKKEKAKAKVDAEELKQKLIDKYEINDTTRRFSHVGEEAEIDIENEDFIAVVIGEKITEFFSSSSQSSEAMCIPEGRLYYFYIGSLCVATEVSDDDNKGSIKNFTSLLFDDSSIKKSIHMAKPDLWYSEIKVTVLSSVKELREYLTR